MENRVLQVVLMKAKVAFIPQTPTNIEICCSKIPTTLLMEEVKHKMNSTAINSKIVTGNDRNEKN